MGIKCSLLTCTVWATVISINGTVLSSEVLIYTFLTNSSTTQTHQTVICFKFKNKSALRGTRGTASVHNTAQNSSDNLPSYLHTSIIAQMLSIGGEGQTGCKNAGALFPRRSSIPSKSAQFAGIVHQNVMHQNVPFSYK